MANFPNPTNSSMNQGSKFSVPEEELITHFLTNKNNNEYFPNPNNTLQDHQLYRYNPQQLAEIYGMQEGSCMYIFNERELKYSNGNVQNRRTPSGFWHATVSKKPLKVDNREIGYKTAFDYREGQKGKGVKTDWLMYEYTLPQDQNAKWVLCKIYQKKESIMSIMMKRVLLLPSAPSNPTVNHCPPAQIINVDKDESTPMQEISYYSSQPAINVDECESAPMNEISYYSSQPAISVDECESAPMNEISYYSSQPVSNVDAPTQVINVDEDEPINHCPLTQDVINLISQRVIDEDDFNEQCAKWQDLSKLSYQDIFATIILT